MKTYVLTLPPIPNMSVLHCGICGIEVHRTLPDEMPAAEAIEAACEAHLTAAHPLRYRLWKRLRWRWLVQGLAP